MAVNDRGIEVMRINTKDIRECKFYWRLLKKDFSSLPSEPVSPYEYGQIINKILNHSFYNQMDINNKIKSMQVSCSQNLLKKEELQWVNKQNSRLIHWLWSHVRSSEYFDVMFGINLTPSTSPNTFNCNYHILNLSTNPYTLNEKYQLIIDYFDLINIPLEQKKALNEQLKSTWPQIFNIERFFWLEDNTEQCEWAWNYTNNIKDTLSKPPVFLVPPPTETSQYYEAMIASFDNWNTHLDTKELFIIKIKKAWGQKKHRDKLDGKKAYNIVMSINTKVKLDHLAKCLDKKKNETIEWLIEQEFNKH